MPAKSRLTILEEEIARRTLLKANPDKHRELAAFAMELNKERLRSEERFRDKNSRPVTEIAELPPF